NLFVVDRFNNSLRKIVISSRDVTTLASLDTGGSNVTDLADQPRGIWGDGTNLYISNSGNPMIQKVVIATGIMTGFAGSLPAPGTADGTGSAARFNIPSQVWGDGVNLYVVDE